eukprot:comp5004_c0_seq1/m.1102 comp5004_c0_seq1/g.1102  ORF comp5004_c0_seq1/g.1102 comp5004_c0_seq1/m.1102 type:complete len:190 (-) comp5004_c0_seq1:133-702(-)
MDPGKITPAEIEFFAEETLVQISTTQTINKLTCIRSQYGPFRARIPTEAPLWLAIALKRRKKCNIHLPEWLSAVELRSVLEAERKNPTKWTKIHQHYMEVGLLLLRHAADDLENANEIRVLLEDIWEVRRAKIKKQLHALQDPVTVELTNLTTMEINTLRNFLSQAMGHFYDMGRVESDINEITNQGAP